MEIYALNVNWTIPTNLMIGHHITMSHFMMLKDVTQNMGTSEGTYRRMAYNDQIPGKIPGTNPHLDSR